MASSPPGFPAILGASGCTAAKEPPGAPEPVEQLPRIATSKPSVLPPVEASENPDMVKLNKGRPPLQDALRSSTRKVLNFGTSVAKILDSVELDTDSEAEELDKERFFERSRTEEAHLNEGGFDAVDANRDGVIDRNEFASFIKAAAKPPFPAPTEADDFAAFRRSSLRSSQTRASTKLSTLETTQASIISMVASDDESDAEHDNDAVVDAPLGESRADAVARAQRFREAISAVAEDNAQFPSPDADVEVSSAKDSHAPSPAARDETVASPASPSEEDYTMPEPETDVSGSTPLKPISSPASGLPESPALLRELEAQEAAEASLHQAATDPPRVVDESPEMRTARPLVEEGEGMEILRLTASDISVAALESSPPAGPTVAVGNEPSVAEVSALSSKLGSPLSPGSLRTSPTAAEDAATAGKESLSSRSCVTQDSPSLPPQAAATPPASPSPRPCSSPDSPHSPLPGARSTESPPTTPGEASPGSSSARPGSMPAPASPSTAELWSQYHNLGEFVKSMSPARGAPPSPAAASKRPPPSPLPRSPLPLSASRGHRSGSLGRSGLRSASSPNPALDKLRADGELRRRERSQPPASPELLEAPLATPMAGAELLAAGSPARELGDAQAASLLGSTSRSTGRRRAGAVPLASPAPYPAMAASRPSPAPNSLSSQGGARAAPPRVVCDEEGSLTGSLSESRAAATPIAKGVEETKMKLEIAQQEVLLNGYQKENEKMADRIRELESKLKHRPEKAPAPPAAASSSTSHAASGTDTALLERELVHHEQEPVELAEAQRRWNAREIELKFEVDKLKSEKRDLETRLSHAESLNAEGDARIRKQVDEAVAKVKQAAEEEQREVHRRLEWYQENQELITKNESALKEQSKLIEMLKKKLVVAAESMVVSQTGDKGKALKVQRAADAKRIAELEKQVRELEGLIDKRNPNSIAAMVRATKPSQEKIREAEKLRDQLARAEAGRDRLEEDHEKAIRAIRQQYERGTAATNRRIATLEEQLKAAQNRNTAKGSAARIKELEKQLSDVRSYYKKKNAELSERVDAIAATPVAESAKPEGGTSKPAEAAPPGDTAALQEALAQKSEEVEALQREVEALRLSVVEARIQTPPQLTRDAAPPTLAAAGPGNTESADDRMYTEHRVRQAEMLLRMREEEMATLRCETARREASFHEEVSKVRQEADRRRVQLVEDHDRELARLQERHQAELKHVAAWNSAHPTAQPTSPAALPAVGSEQGASALVDTKMQCSYLELQRKLEELELRHQARELEMQRMLNATKKAREAELSGASAKYDEMVAAKNKQIESFRNEMAAILGELSRLQEERALRP